MAVETSAHQLQADRSPSPALAPPTPSAPGPRATALQKLYADAVAHILKTNCYANFAACFPTSAREVEGSLKMLHTQFNDKLGESMKAHFDDILLDRNVLPSLNELDRLVEEAKKRKARTLVEEGKDAVAVSPAHTLPAQQLYLAQLAPSLAQYSQDLTMKQDMTQAENVNLLDRVMQQRQEISGLMQGLESVIADLDASVAALKPEEMDGLRDEMREVDDEMRVTA